MSVIKWEPLSELDHLLDARSLPSLTKFGGDLAIDVYEENGAVVAKVSLPGVKPEEVEVSIENGALTIVGRREEEAETENKAYYSKEIRRGSFYRTTMLPTDVEAGKAAATFENGMLTVTVPISKDAKENVVKVPINA